MNNGLSIREALNGLIASLFLGGALIFIILKDIKIVYLGIDFSFFVLLLGIFIIGFGIYLFFTTIHKNLHSEETKIALFVEKYQVEDSKKKYLAVAAVYYNFPYDTIFCLKSYSFQSKKEIEDWKKGVEKSWGLTDHASTIKRLDLLLQEGHRKNPAYQSSLDSYVAQVTSKNMTPEIKQFIHTVKNIYISNEAGYIKEEQIYACHSMAAWDYLRGLNLARIAYNLGYLTEEEAWSYIEAFAMKVKEDFNSWEEVAVSFLIGRYFWSDDPDQQEFSEYFTSLFYGGIEESQSVWQQYPFSTL